MHSWLAQLGSPQAEQPLIDELETMLYEHLLDCEVPAAFPSQLCHRKMNEVKGLNNHHYIVPGAGGLGEILNNSFC